MLATGGTLTKNVQNKRLEREFCGFPSKRGPELWIPGGKGN